MKESVLTRRILRELKRRGGWWIKIHGSASQTTGIPDIIGCYRGRFIGIEIKLPNRRSKLTKRQRFILKRIITQGGYARVIRSTEACSGFMDAIDRELDHDSLTK